MEYQEIISWLLDFLKVVRKQSGGEALNNLSLIELIRSMGNFELHFFLMMKINRIFVQAAFDSSSGEKSLNDNNGQARFSSHLEKFSSLFSFEKSKTNSSMGKF